MCKEFQARSATLGRDAQGEVNIEVEYQGGTYRGRGVSTDTVESTIRAILNAVNRIILGEKRKQIQQEEKGSQPQQEEVDT